MRARAIFALLLALATLLTYAPVLENDFTSFDDPQYIVDNPQVRGGLSAEGIRWAFTHAHSDNWHPLSWLSHMVDVELFGLDPRGHHAVSVGLHAINGVLLFLILARATRQPVPSALVAMLFALHPLRVESVAWAAERKDVLSGLFFLLSVLAYLRYAERPSTLRKAAVTGLFALGLLAKPMLVTLPFLLLLLDRWPLERSRRLWPAWPLWWEKAPLFVLSLASAGVTLWAQSIGGTLKSLEFISPLDRVLNAATSVWIYLYQTVWPTGLAFFYPHPALVATGGFPAFETQGVLALLALAGATAWVVHRSRDEPWWAVGWGFGLVALLPVIGIVQVGVQAHADRYTYLPGIGFLIAGVFGLAHALRADERSTPDGAFVLSSRSKGLAGAGLAVAIVLAGLTARQVGVWRSSQDLYQHALVVTQNNYIAAFNLGALASAAGDEGTALGLYRLAIAMRPGYAAAHSNVGVILDRIGARDEAEASYREALRLEPRLTQAAINLGGLYVGRGEVERARAIYQRAVEARPDLALPREVLGDLDVRLGRVEEAIAQFEAARAIAPGAATLRTRLADAYAMVGREHEAIEQYEAALSIDPAQLAAMNALARTLATAEASGLRDATRALTWARRANQATDGRNPSFLMTLALAHAAAGEDAEALRQRDRSLGFAKPEERPGLSTLFERHRGQTPREGDASS